MDLFALLDMLVQRDALGRQRRALAELDDRMLDDIGLTRADVAAELRRPAPVGLGGASDLLSLRKNRAAARPTP